MNVLPRTPMVKRGIFSPTLKKLVTWSAIWSALYFFSNSYKYGLNLQVSRRLANLPYVLWVSAFNTCQLFLFCAIESLFFPTLETQLDTKAEKKLKQQATSRILQAFNRNGLALFLLANLMTGIINMLLPTLTMTDLQAMGVLLAYIAVISAVALLLDMKGLSIKL